MKVGEREEMTVEDEGEEVVVGVKRELFEDDDILYTPEAPGAPPHHTVKSREASRDCLFRTTQTESGTKRWTIVSCRHCSEQSFVYIV